MSAEKMEINEAVLAQLLELSRLSPECTNLEILTGQVKDVVGYFEILSRYTGTENPYDAYPSTVVQNLRDNSVVKGLEIPDLKKMTEHFVDGYVEVPKVLGEGA